MIVVQMRFTGNNDKVTWRTFGCEHCLSQAQIYKMLLIGQNQVRATVQGHPSRIELKLPRNSSNKGLGRSEVIFLFASQNIDVTPC